MFLTVVIPVYNGEKFLEDAITSVSNQPCKDIEILCVNDGSTDSSSIILERFACANPQVRVITQHNQGVAAARNKGIQEACGKYISFLDQDDIYCSSAVSDELCAQISKNQFDFISFSYYDSNQNITRARFLPREDCVCSQPAQRAGEHYRHHSSYFYRTAFLRENMILVDEYRNEDERFRMQCIYLAKDALYCSNPLFIYRNNQLSVTHQNGKEKSSILESCLQGFLNLGKTTRNKNVKNYCEDTVLHLLLEYAQALAEEGKTSSVIQKKMDSFGVSERYTRRRWISSLDQSMWNRYFNHLGNFILRCRIRLTVEIIARTILRLPTLQKWFESKKYPIQLP